MDLTKILSIVFGVVALVLAYVLFNSIKTSIDEAEYIARMESRIITQLEMIREAQIAFQAVNGRYTGDEQELLSFIDTGSFYIIERKETVITLDYGADSVYVELDTLGTVPVMDSIFTKEKYPNFQLENLMFIPGTNGEKKFEMWAGKIERGGVTVDVVEVRNVAPVDPERKEDADSNMKKPLRFGSRTNVTTAGNWE